MKAESLAKLKAILTALDEDGLVALTNKGLVRRAIKDLESCSITIEEQEDQFVLKGPDWTVWMPADGPAKAKDDTPATGITRQILAASIYLRKHLLSTSAQTKSPLESNAREDEVIEAFPAEANNKPQETEKYKSEQNEPKVSEPIFLSPAELKMILRNLTADELIKWSGKALFKEVQEQTAMDLEEEPSGTGLLFRFPLHDIEVRILPSTESSAKKLLESIISTAPKALHKRWVLSAIMELNRAEGKELEFQEKLSADETEEQKKILRNANILLENMLAAGISHPSERIIERLSTLSVAAASNYMPRLAFLLRTLSQEVYHLLNREVAANTQLLFDNMSWTVALLRAIENASKEVRTEFAGVARTHYSNAGDLQLCGLGAFPWQSESGFEGITLILWEQTKQKLYTWSASRPKNNNLGFDVNHIYSFESIWSGAGTTETLTRSTITLKNARANASGRLSSSQQSSASDVQALDPALLNFGEREFSDWSLLKQYASSQYPCGLKLLNPLDRNVIITPTKWGERFFDEMQQALCWQLFDSNGQLLLLTLPWNQTNERSIEFIESLKPERDRLHKLLARIVLNNSGYAIEPISFISKGTPAGDRVLNPAFDHKRIEYRQSALLEKLKAKHNLSKIPTALLADDDWQELIKSHSVADFAPPIIHQSIADLERILLFLAESGAKIVSDQTREQLALLSDKMARSGLLVLAEELAEALQKEIILPSEILWLNYLCKLHWQALAKSFAA